MQAERELEWLRPMAVHVFKDEYGGWQVEAPDPTAPGYWMRIDPTDPPKWLPAGQVGDGYAGFDTPEAAQQALNVVPPWWEMKTCGTCGGELLPMALGECGPGAAPSTWEGLGCKRGCILDTLPEDLK